MDKFLETSKLPRLNHENIKYLRRVIISNEIESVIRKPPTKPKIRLLHWRILLNT